MPHPRRPRHNTHDNEHSDICASTGNISRCVGAGPHVAAVDGGEVCEGVGNGDCCAAFGEGAREGCCDPGYDDGVGGEDAEGHSKWLVSICSREIEGMVERENIQEHSEVAYSRNGRGYCNDIPH